jgi:hypothetical protein
VIAALRSPPPAPSPLSCCCNPPRLHGDALAPPPRRPPPSSPPRFLHRLRRSGRPHHPSSHGAAADGVPAATEYEEVLGRLPSLITQKVRAHSGNQWELMAQYLKVHSSPPLPSYRNALAAEAYLIRLDLAVTCLFADSGAGGADRADEGGSRRRNQGKGKRTIMPCDFFRDQKLEVLKFVNLNFAYMALVCRSAMQMLLLWLYESVV